MTLAEPNLTATNGQPASFFGRRGISCPGGLDDGKRSSSDDHDRIQDIRRSLDVTPTIIDPDHLVLRIRSEVSESTTGSIRAALYHERRSLFPHCLTVRAPRPRSNSAAARVSSSAGCCRTRILQNISKIPWSRRHPGSRPVVPLGAVSAQRDRTGHHRHPVSRTAGQSAACDAGGRVPRAARRAARHRCRRLSPGPARAVRYRRRTRPGFGRSDRV